jgi:hypothetical protein
MLFIRRSHKRSSEIARICARQFFVYRLKCSSDCAQTGDEVSKISREIEDKAVAAPRNISQNPRLATIFTRTPIAFNQFG